MMVGSFLGVKGKRKERVRVCACVRGAYAFLTRCSCLRAPVLVNIVHRHCPCRLCRVMEEEHAAGSEGQALAHVSVPACSDPQAPVREEGLRPEPAGDGDGGECMNAV